MGGQIQVIFYMKIVLIFK